MKNLREFNVEVCSEDLFKPITGNESLHELGIDNGVTAANFTASKNAMFPDHNIH
jgi:hypothetical protein